MDALDTMEYKSIHRKDLFIVTMIFMFCPAMFGILTTLCHIDGSFFTGISLQDSKYYRSKVVGL